MDIILFLAACGLAVLASGLAKENNELRETIERQEKSMQSLCRILHGSVLGTDKVSGMVQQLLRQSKGADQRRKQEGRAWTRRH